MKKVLLVALATSFAVFSIVGALIVPDVPKDLRAFRRPARRGRRKDSTLYSFQRADLSKYAEAKEMRVIDVSTGDTLDAFIQHVDPMVGPIDSVKADPEDADIFFTCYPETVRPEIQKKHASPTGEGTLWIHQVEPKPGADFISTTVQDQDTRDHLAWFSSTFGVEWTLYLK